MKKAISLILAICLVAAMAISASAATVVVHDQTAEETMKQIEHARCGEASREDYLKTTNYVKILSITDGTKQTLTTCAQAITIDELQAICDENEDIENLTVFKQRNVKGDGAIDISVKLWPCNPQRKQNQAVVILFRAADSEEWSVVGYNDESNECEATLAGDGAYVVAMAW